MLADLRLFGADRPRVTLYRDSASWCPYCQKAWIALEERRVPYEVVRVDMRCYGEGKPAEFLRIQPSGNLPCAVIDGAVVAESNDVVEAIDEIGDQSTPRLRHEEGTADAERVRHLCDDGRNSLERRLYARWMWWLTGVRKPAEYKFLYEEHLDEVEEALAQSPGPFFLGKKISIVDVRFIPFMERQVATFAYFKGFNVRDQSRWPNLVRWLEAMESRPSYRATKSDWYTHSRALPPQLAADCVFEAGHESMKASIDALPVLLRRTQRASQRWREPGWGDGLLPRNVPAARREAAERLIYNRERISSFACRGAGVPGLPASSAPLADPRSTPNESVAPAVDLMLRAVASALLERGGREVSPPALGENAAVLALSGGACGPDACVAVADCLDYLRSRVGVPRDMSYPAAL